MSETDPTRLADDLEAEADKLERHSREIEGKVQDARQDWQRKRQDPSVPGAPPPPDDDTEEADSSPAPQAPPEGAHPSAAEMAPEGATGPPKDQIEESQSD